MFVTIDTHFYMTVSVSYSEHYTCTSSLKAMYSVVKIKRKVLHNAGKETIPFTSTFVYASAFCAVLNQPSFCFSVHYAKSSFKCSFCF